MTEDSDDLSLLGYKLKVDPAFRAQLADATAPLEGAAYDVFPSLDQTLILLATCRTEPHLVRFYEIILREAVLPFAYTMTGIERLAPLRLMLLAGLFEVLDSTSPPELVSRAADGLPEFCESLVEHRAASPEEWTWSNSGLVTCVLAAAQGFLSRCSQAYVCPRRAPLTSISTLVTFAPWSVPLALICVAVAGGPEPLSITPNTLRSIGDAFGAYLALFDRMEAGALGFGLKRPLLPERRPTFELERPRNRINAAFAATVVAGLLGFLAGTEDIVRIAQSVSTGDVAAALMASVALVDLATASGRGPGEGSQVLLLVGRTPGQLLAALTDPDEKLPPAVVRERGAQLELACASGLHLKLLELYQRDDTGSASVLDAMSKLLPAGHGLTMPTHTHIAFVHVAFEQIWAFLSTSQRVELAEAGLVDALAKRAAYFAALHDTTDTLLGMSPQSAGRAELCSGPVAVRRGELGRCADRALDQRRGGRLGRARREVAQLRYGADRDCDDRARRAPSAHYPWTLRARRIGQGVARAGGCS